MRVLSPLEYGDTVVDQPTIRNELKRILESKPFAKSESLSSFLRFVVESTLDGQEKTIKQFTVAVEVFGLGPEFDPQSDPFVRLKAGQLRRALDSYYANSSNNAIIRIHIPKGSYIPRFAWQDRKLDEPNSFASNSSQDQAHPGIPTIVVLPFKNLSGAENEHRAIGLGEELATELTRLKHTRVIDYYSSLHASTHETDNSEIGRKLHADFFLAGSIKELDGCFRLNMKLVKVKSGEQVWANRYNFRLKEADLAKFFEESLTQIAHEIGDDYGVVSQCMFGAYSKELSNATVYDAVLKAMKYQLTLDPDDCIDAQGALVQATSINPNFAPAWAHLAVCYLDMYMFGFGQMEDPLAEGARCAGKAIALDRCYYFSHFVKAYLDAIKGNKESVVASAKEILRLNPKSAYARGAAGFWYAIGGEYEKGVELIESSIELNPFFPSWFFFAHFLLNVHLENYDKAFEYAELISLPGLFWSPLVRTVSSGLTGKKTEAIQNYRELLLLKPDFPTKARKYVSFFAPSDEIMFRFLEGLSVAGWTDTRQPA